MITAVTAGVAIVVAIVAAEAGYLFRRREHLRERRLNAYQTVFAAFLDAARSAADLLSVHMTVGWPRDLNPRPTTKISGRAWRSGMPRPGGGPRRTAGHPAGRSAPCG
jgi:hypothetical protein